jgi:hypothetical protein
MQTAAVTRALTEGQSTPRLTATGLAQFSDLDLADTHTATATLQSTTASGGAVVSADLAAALQTAMTAHMVDPSTGDGHGQLQWDYAVANGDVDARVRDTARAMAHGHGSETRRFFSQDLDEELCCREHNPRDEQGRTRKQQEVIEDSGHDNSPCARPPASRPASAGRRRDGDTSNLALNARRFDWFPTQLTFFG